MFIAIASITVVGPVLFYLFASDKAGRPLTAIKEFMAEHDAVIMMVVLLVLGAKVLGQGFAGVTN